MARAPTTKGLEARKKCQDVVGRIREAGKTESKMDGKLKGVFKGGKEKRADMFLVTSPSKTLASVSDEGVDDKSTKHKGHLFDVVLSGEEEQGNASEKLELEEIK